MDIPRGRARGGAAAGDADIPRRRARGAAAAAPRIRGVFRASVRERRNGTGSVSRAPGDRYGVDFYAGDEDNGEMGAWFVLAAAGLFSVSPASEDYVVGAPLFDRLSINGVPGRPPFEVIAHRARRGDVSVEKTIFVDANGAESRLDAPTLRYSALARGGALHVYMKGAPAADAAPAAAAGGGLAATRDAFWSSV